MLAHGPGEAETAVGRGGGKCCSERPTRRRAVEPHSEARRETEATAVARRLLGLLEESRDLHMTERVRLLRMLGEISQEVPES